MDGVHDLGGTDGFGVVEVEADEPVFHEAWEPIGYATGIIGFGRRFFTIDEFRHAVERMAPRQYMSSTYYERVLTGVASLYVEKGIITLQELEEAAGGLFPLATPPGEGLAARESDTQFAIGESVVAINTHFKGHCRMPKYVRGKKGIVIHITPPFPFASAAGHGLEAKHEPTYHVQFNAKDLWSDAADNSSVVVDLWQSYLDKIDGQEAIL